MSADRTVVSVGGRELSLGNLHKVLYPAAGTTKAEVIEYYARIAPVMVPHLAGRCITFKRFPDGVEK
ncbi:MAG: ATP-dependent DNA ligase, partial [Actinomycetota bacterium]